MPTNHAGYETLADGRTRRWKADTRARSAVKTLTMMLPKVSDEVRAELAAELRPLTAAYER